MLTWEADLGVGEVLAEGCTSISVFCMLRLQAGISSHAQAQRLARAYTLYQRQVRPCSSSALLL